MLLNTAEKDLLSGVYHRYAQNIGRGKTWYCLAAASGVFLAAGAVAIVAATYIWASKIFPIETALLIMGALLIALAVLTAAALYAYTKYKKRKMEAIKNEITENLTEMMKVAKDELSEPIQENPGTALLVAGASGFLIGQKML